MLNRYQVQILEGGPADRQQFTVSADCIQGAAVRAGYELQQQETAELIRMIDNYAFISWGSEGILCEIVQANE